MTTISSIEELRSLDEGTLITAPGERDPEEWHRTGSGFRRGGVEVPIEFFTGLASSGNITVGPRYEQGRFYGTVGRNLYFMYDIEDEGTTTRFRYVYAYDDSSYCDQMVASNDRLPNYGPVVPESEWTTAMRHIAGVANILGQQVRDNRALRAQVAERSGADADALRREGMEALATSIREAWDGTSFTESEINEVLDEHNLGHLPVEQEDVSITVTIDAAYELETRDVDRMVSSSYEVGTYPTLEYSVTWETTRSADRGACMCSDITQSEVEQWMRDEDNRFDSLTFECDCAND